MQTKRGADAFERQLLNEFNEDEAHGMNPFAGPPPTFGEFAERWMREYVSPRNRPSGQREKSSYLRHHLLPAFGSMRIDLIGQQEIDAFVAKLVGQQLAPKTINNILTVIRACLNTAREWGLLRQVPKIRQLRVPEQPYKFLTAAEAERLVNATRPGFWRAFVVLLLDTGIRFCEAAALRWSDAELDGTSPAIHVSRGAVRGVIGQTKTGHIRNVPLTERVVATLRQVPRDHDLIFHTFRGEPLRPEWTLTYLHRMCDRAGVKRVGWHALRHSFATFLCQRGVPLRDVQALLGHTTITMTSRYAHATADDLHFWMRLAFGELNGHQAVTNPTLPAPAAALRVETAAQRSAKPTLMVGSHLVDRVGFEPAATSLHDGA